MASSPASVLTSSGSEIDLPLLRNAVRLVHCIQKERGTSCAYYADNSQFEKAMLEARTSSDIAASLTGHRDLPIVSSLAKIRNLIETHRNPQETRDNLALHRIFVCFNTLISSVVHEYILKQITRGDHRTYKSTIKNRHKRGLSSDINDKLLSAFTVTPDRVSRKSYPTIPHGARMHTNLETLQSFPDDGSEGSDEAPAPPPAVPPPTSPLGASEFSVLSPSRQRLSFAPLPPKVWQLLDLLHLFVQMKESTGEERAILSTLLAFRGSDDPSVGMLMSDLILEVENQRKLVKQLENLPEDGHRNLVLDLASLTPELNELQSIILSDFDSLQNAEYDSETIWDLITLYVDKLHSVELLIIEELECSLPLTMQQVLSATASRQSDTSTSRSQQLTTSSENGDKGLQMSQILRQVFPPSNGSTLVSQIESMDPSSLKDVILDLLQKDEASVASFSSAMSEGGSENHSAANNLQEDMNKALTTTPKRTTSGAWEISIYELKFTRRIGVGAAATTYMADWTGQKVAVKVASTSKFGLEGWRTEVDALQRLHHPNIIRLLGSVYHENPLTYCLVLEYCNSGDLSTVLKYPTPRCFFFLVSISIANAMSYLHSRKVVHRDLKPANVLCDGNVASGNFTIKVTDFGVATEVDESLPSFGAQGRELEKDLTGETGTYRWMAPEVVRHESYSTMADVYSFGVMLWQFVTHEEPFLDISATEAAQLVAIEKRRPQIPSGTPPAVAELIQVNWSDNPDERLPFEKVGEKLREIQNSATQEEKTFLEAASGHPVYVYEEPKVEPEDAKTGPGKPGKKGPTKAAKQADNGPKRGSLLSSFFGQRKGEKRGPGGNRR